MLPPVDRFLDDAVPCVGIAHLNDGTTVTRLHVFAVERNDSGIRSIALTSHVTLADGEVVLSDGTRLTTTATFVAACALWTADDLPVGVEVGAIVEVDDAGRATHLSCHAEF